MELDQKAAAYYEQTQNALYSWRLPREMPDDLRDPCIVLKFKRDNNHLTLFAVYDLVVYLHQYSGVEFKPVSYSGDRDGKDGEDFSIGLACSSKADYNGHDLRNVLQLPEYEAALVRYGVAEVEFKNFPKPFSPRSRHGVRYVL